VQEAAPLLQQQSPWLVHDTVDGPLHQHTYAPLHEDTPALHEHVDPQRHTSFGLPVPHPLMLPPHDTPLAQPSSPPESFPPPESVPPPESFPPPASFPPPEPPSAAPPEALPEPPSPDPGAPAPPRVTVTPQFDV
jgi:hypothetical protein